MQKIVKVKKLEFERADAGFLLTKRLFLCRLFILFSLLTFLPNQNLIAEETPNVSIPAYIDYRLEQVTSFSPSEISAQKTLTRAEFLNSQVSPYYSKELADERVRRLVDFSMSQIPQMNCPRSRVKPTVVGEFHYCPNCLAEANLFDLQGEAGKIIYAVEGVDGNKILHSLRGYLNFVGSLDFVKDQYTDEEFSSVEADFPEAVVYYLTGIFRNQKEFYERLLADLPPAGTDTDYQRIERSFREVADRENEFLLESGEFIGQLAGVKSEKLISYLTSVLRSFFSKKENIDWLNSKVDLPGAPEIFNFLSESAKSESDESFGVHLDSLWQIHLRNLSLAHAFAEKICLEENKNILEAKMVVGLLHANGVGAALRNYLGPDYPVTVDPSGLRFLDYSNEKRREHVVGVLEETGRVEKILEEQEESKSLMEIPHSEIQ